jgi:hypothetical protein
MSFPPLMQSSSVCDGVDDDPLWEPAILERDEHFVGGVWLIGPHSPICDPVSSSVHAAQLSEPLRPRHNVQIGRRPSYASRGRNGDEDSLEPH